MLHCIKPVQGLHFLIAKLKIICETKFSELMFLVYRITTSRRLCAVVRACIWAPMRADCTALASTSDRMNVILYHYPCPDGVWAAWCAHRHFKQRDAPARYVPHRVYEALLPEALQLRGDETCYLLDYVGPTGLAAQLAGLCRRYCTIDCN